MGVFGDAGRLEQRAQRGQNELQRQLLPFVMPHRNVPSPAGGHRERQPRQLRPHRVQGGGFAVKGEAARFPQGGNHRLQLFPGADYGVVGFRRRRVGGGVRAGRVRVGNARHHAEKLQLGQQFHHLAAVIAPKAASLQLQVHRRGAVDGHQGAVVESPLPVFAQRRLDAGRLYRVQVFVDSLQRAVFPQQGGGAFFAHPRDAGDVVGGVAHQRLEIGLLPRAQAGVALRQFRLVIHPPVLNTGRQIDPYPRGNQLESVAVAGEDHRINARRLRLAGKGADNIVRFPPVQLKNGNAESDHKLFHPVELGAQFRRRRGALRLVIRELPVPESGRRSVESDGAIGRAPFLQSPQEHIGEPENAGGILAHAAGKVALGGYRPERTMHHSVAVHNHQQRAALRGEKGHRHSHSGTSA